MPLLARVAASFFMGKACCTSRLFLIFLNEADSVGGDTFLATGEA